MQRPSLLLIALLITACSPAGEEQSQPPGSEHVATTSAPLTLGALLKIKASDSAAGDALGQAVVIHGDMALLGAPKKGAGAAYYYTRSGTTWTQRQKLTASDGASGDLFGQAVALDSDTLAVGALQDDDRGADSGSVYIFKRNGSLWSQAQKLTASDGAAGDALGGSLALTNGALLAGAHRDDDRGTDSGSAYAFTRSGTTWSQQRKLTSSDGAAGDAFGAALDLDSVRALVGARGDDDRGAGSGSAYVFSRAGTAWTQARKLTASDGAAGDAFATSLSLTNATATLGAPADDDRGVDSGSAYSFARSGSVWTQAQKLTAAGGKAGDRFGTAMRLEQNGLLMGAPGDDAKGTNAGAAYLFLRAGSSAWAQENKLLGSQASANDALGTAVGLSGDVVLLGVPGDADKGTGAGAGYLQQLCMNKGLRQSQKVLAAGSSTQDRFGYAAAATGSYAVIGVPEDDNKGSQSGSAYIYQRIGTTWLQAQLLLASDGAPYDFFGRATAIDTNIALVGSPYHDATYPDSGAAYVYTLSGGIWIQNAKLTASDRNSSDLLGAALDTGGGLVIAGAAGDDDRGSASGSAYVFAKSGSWYQQAKLTAYDGASSDQFGQAVATTGTEALVGSPGDDDKGTNSGSVYTFSRNGSAWIALGKLLASDGKSSDAFGQAVALDKTIAVVGAPTNDARGTDAGAAYVFVRTGAIWAQQAKLTANDGSVSANFGKAVTVHGDRVLVGAPTDKDRGAAYLFQRSGTVWTQRQKIIGTGTTNGDSHGQAVGLTSDAALVSSPADDDKGTDSGSAYFFQLQCGNVNGAPCTYNSSCTSGACANEVCCNSPCGNAGDCLVCSMRAGAKVDGECALAKSGSICRVANGPCDKPDTCNGSSSFCSADQVQPSSVICRKAVSSCDDPEKCSGYSKTCPTDRYMVQGVPCRAAAGTCDKQEVCNGSTAVCPADVGLTKGTVCRTAIGFCDHAEVCDGTSKSCPTDAYKPSTSICRYALMPCDKSEYCTGSSATCPANSYKATGAVCRTSVGPCDIAETCNGSSSECPGNSLRPSGYSCRPSTGSCDIAEICDGSSGLCPINEFRLPNHPCRVSAGDCDPAEYCSGLNGSCPVDKRTVAGTTCRLAAGPCDGAETCDGSSATCPADKLKASGAVCRAAAGGCDVAETCSGTSYLCPLDIKMLFGAVCRTAAGPCDLAETCNGSSTTCPSDQYKLTGAVCRAAAGVCDAAETCDGKATSCPTDGVKATGTACRTAAGPCDAAETCDGKVATCPADALAASGAICRKAADLCDTAETCDGKIATCPTDTVQAKGATCRAAAGGCDVPELCDGAATGCPADAYKPNAASCRTAAGECDVPELCSGTVAACPQDVYKPNGSACLSGNGTCQAGKCFTDAGVVGDMGTYDGDMGASDATGGDAEAGASDAEAGIGDAEAGAGDAAGSDGEAGVTDGTSADGEAGAAADLAGTDTGTGGDGEEEGCSCSTTAGGGDGWPLLLLLMLVGVIRRRRVGTRN